MSLPGKLCIGILEEDNPLRSYFRFKPLLIDEGGSYVPYADVDGYPDEGCIRIVPDKNESYYFKARMRQNGLFCVVDLREHPAENDKIRPNKNYRPGGEEINGFIIYSDVVRGPAPNMIYQVLPAASAGAILPAPDTESVLLREGDELLPDRCAWEAVETSQSIGQLRNTGEPCPAADMQVFDLPGFRGETISFAILPASKVTAVCEAPERPPRRGEEKHEADRGRASEPKAEKPSEDKKREPAPEAKAEKPPETKPEKAPEAKPEKTPEAKPEKAPEAKPDKASEEKPDAALDGGAAEKVPEEAPKAAPDAAPEAAPAAEAKAEPAPEEKPWIHHDASMMPRPVDRRLSRSEQMMAAQAGLNPRRGRSLQELIDEKWAHSRMNQLGMPVSPIATGAPLQNPVDAAVAALRDVWDQPNMRPQLMQALSQVSELDVQLRSRRDAVLKSTINKDLDALEAQRLELLGELERLKTGNQRLRERLKQDILKEEARTFAEAVGKTRAAQEELQKYTRQAEDARAAAKDAQGLLDALAGEELDRKIRDVALTRRVAERLEMLKDAEEGPAAPMDVETIDIAALIARFEARMAAEGWRSDRFEAANLCVCLALSPALMLSGAPGSGKTAAAGMLMDALGVSAAGRTAACTVSKKPLMEDARVKALAKRPDAPAVLLLDDANLAPGPALARDMGALPGPEWRMIVTLQDAHSGMPVCAGALDRGFMVRMVPPEDLPWRPAEPGDFEAPPLASIAAVAKKLPCAEVPGEIAARMEALRRDVAACGATISRRALNDAWRYCAAMLAILGDGADALRVFDCAVAQRVLPGLLAASPDRAMGAICEALKGLPQCRAMLNAPLPVMV